MTKTEFLAKLQESLENDLEGQEVYENMAYYRSYIDDEIAGGRSETEVLEELGDPWVIAQSVINMSDNTLTPNDTYTYSDNRDNWRDNRKASDEAGWNTSDWGTGSFRTYQIDTWWKKLLLILVVVGIIGLITAVVAGLFTVLAPFMVPALVIVMVLRLIFGHRRW